MHLHSVQPVLVDPRAGAATDGLEMDPRAAIGAAVLAPLVAAITRSGNDGASAPKMRSATRWQVLSGR